MPLTGEEIWGAGLSTAGPMKWFSVQSSTRHVTGMYMVFDRALKVLDGIEFPRSPQTVSVLPDVDTAGETEIRVVTPGESRGAYSRTLQANGMIIGRFQDIFSGVTPAPTD